MAILFWGATPVATKFAVSSIDAVMTGVLRSIIAGPIAVALALALRLPFPATGRERMLLVVSGLTSFAIWPTLLSTGIGLTTAAHAGLILALIPIVTGLFASFIGAAWPRLRWWLGSSIAVIGTFVLIINTALDAGAQASITGDLIIFLGIIACAIGYIAGAKITPVIGTWATTFWGIAMSAVLLVPVAAALRGRTDWANVDSVSWTAMLYLAFFGTIGGYVAWFWALDRGGVTRIASWQLAQPVITLGLAAYLLSEQITLPLVLVAVSIVAGTAWAQLPERGR
ncbi:MAG: DMT family transporter [Gammaproteobacteria bacterium]|nr:DMT family transporter [Gammaproteobacteria bacterium]